MSLVGLALVLTVLSGQSDQKAAVEKVSVAMVAVEARNVPSEGKTKTYGKGIASDYQAAFSRLPYNSFTLLKSDKGSAEYGKEVRLAVDDTYTLCVTPVGKERNGSIRVEIRMEEKKGDAPPRNAVKSTSIVVPGDKLLLRVPKAKEGELVIALCVKD